MQGARVELARIEHFQLGNLRGVLFHQVRDTPQHPGAVRRGETGPAAVLVRFPEGYEEPWHSHSSTYHSVLVRGEFQSRSKDELDSTTVYGPGSYAIQPGGAAHREVNAGSGELVAFVFFEGPIDFVPAE